VAGQPPRMWGPPAPREPPVGPPAAPLLTSATDPHRSKPKERSPIGVERPKCPTNKNNDKIYQIKQ
jgi:hypothetical protein